MTALGKRRTAALAVLVARGRSTGLDIAKCVTRDHGVSMTWHGALGEVVALEDVGLVEAAAPHRDERGCMRGTWKPTEAGRVALADALKPTHTPTEGLPSRSRSTARARHTSWANTSDARLLLTWLPVRGSRDV